MKGAGRVTLGQVEGALETLGGQAPWDRILAEVTRLRNGDYSYYLNKENYEKTAFQVIQEHCPGYKKYKGITHFEKSEDMVFRLSSRQKPIAEHLQPKPDIHTPRATDIQDVSQPERVKQETYRILRDTALARMVKETHQYQCQICGRTLRIRDGLPYAEAHHIKPLGAPHNGPDVRGNILCLCPNDHVLLDYGAIRLDQTSLHEIDKEYVDYYNANIYDKALV
jgi:5-methylcytosine-specific restriction endonuclease McrA